MRNQIFATVLLGTMMFAPARAAAQVQCIQNGWLTTCNGNLGHAAPPLTDLNALQGGLDNLPTPLNEQRAANQLELQRQQIELQHQQIELQQRQLDQPHMSEN